MWHYRGLAVKNKEKVMQRKERKLVPLFKRRGHIPSIPYLLPSLKLSVLDHYSFQTLFTIPCHTCCSHNHLRQLQLCSSSNQYDETRKAKNNLAGHVQLFNKKASRFSQFQIKQENINPDGEQYKPQSKTFSDLRW